MALPSTGTISFNNLNQELGRSSPYNQQVSLNDASVRTLFGSQSGNIGMHLGYGKSVPPPYQKVFSVYSFEPPTPMQPTTAGLLSLGLSGGTPTVSSSYAKFGTQSITGATTSHVVFPKPINTYINQYGSFTVEGFMYVVSTPSAYWTMIGFESSNGAAYVKTGIWANGGPMIVDSISGGGNGGGTIPVGVWTHIFLTSFEDSVYLGINGVYTKYSNSGSNIRSLSSYSTIDSVYIGYGSTGPYSGASPNVYYDGMRIMGYNPYASSGASSGTYTIPSTTLLV